MIYKNKQLLIALSSVLIPGLGQVLNKKISRGLILFLSTIIVVFLINWSRVFYGTGSFQLLGIELNWLYIFLLLFWLWNIIDSIMVGRGKSANLLPSILCIFIILIAIAWDVTEVKVDRLINRIGDARVVVTKILNPDFFAVDVNGKSEVCGWICLWTNLTNGISGKETQKIIFSKNPGDIFGRIQTESSLGDPIDPTFVVGKLIETIAIGLMATIFSSCIALPLSFLGARNIMERLPGGNWIYHMMRTLFNLGRAVDTFIWGIFVVVWVGLGSFAGVIALTIHSTAALAKLFSEEIENIDPGPLEAITASGGNTLQIIRYAVIPQIIPPFLSYTLLRWDINMRSATVVGFVAGGGIGYFVLETIRVGAYQQYAAALWSIAVVIIVIDHISSHLRESILLDKPKAIRKEGFLGYIKPTLSILIGIVIFLYSWNITQIKISSLFQPGPTFLQIVKDFLFIDVQAATLNTIFRQMIVTILQSMLATFLGALFAIPASFLAAKNLTGKNRVLSWLYYSTRSIFNIFRSIEALLYVAIFVYWVGIGPFAGMLALSITAFALLGKLFSEAIENIDPGHIEAVVATGANKIQTIIYAIVPQVVPPFVSYLIYQWDINIRMATIIGFAGGGGIGLTLSTYFGSLQYHKAGTVVLFIVVVVVLMDYISAKIREKFI